MTTLNPKAKALRREAGRYIANLRSRLDMSQLALSKRLGHRYYTFISQVEGGHARVPSDAMAQWAEALEVDLKVFAKTLLRYYDPAMFAALFGPDDRSQ